MVGRSRGRGRGTAPVWRAIAFLVFVWGLGLALSGTGFAQAGAVPDLPDGESQGPEEPTVLIGDVVIEEAYHDEIPGASALIDDLIAAYRGRRWTASELYALSLLIESHYQAAGYFLTRVTIPPQELDDGGTFRLLVIDGYLEGVNLDGVPENARWHLERLFSQIVHRPRLTAQEFERAVALARQSPGLTVRTTLVPGTGVGAGVLVVEGERTPYQASLSVNNRLSVPNVPWHAAASVQLFQPLGRGDQWSLNISGPLSSLLPPFHQNGAVSRSGGATLRWPVGTDGRWLQLNYSASYNYMPSPHWLIPDTRTDNRRASLEYSDPIYVDRRSEFRLTTALESTDQVMDAPDFDVELYRDGLRVLKLSANARQETAAGGLLTGTLELSQGLAFGSRGLKDVIESGVPFSRVEAIPGFAKLSISGVWRHPLASRLSLTTSVRGQVALVGPLPTTELFSITGGNGLPSLDYGIDANDHGWTVREEINQGITLLDGRLHLTLFGYVGLGSTAGDVFGAGTGIARAAGVGVRGQVGPLSLTVEHSRGWAKGYGSDALEASAEVVF